MLSSLKTTGNKRLLFFPLLILTFVLAMAWIDGKRYNFIPCKQDCGETFIAEQAAANYRLYGFKYNLVQDHSTIHDPDRVPYLYTHNIHIGTLTFSVLEAIGIKALWAKQIITLMVFGIGLLYLFLFVHDISNSFTIALTTLLLFVTEYSQVYAFALNALRAWHWLAIFGLLFHISRLCESNKFKIIDLIGVLICSGIALGVGYEFAAICIMINVLLIAFKTTSIRKSINILLFFGVSVFLFFLLRQLQVMSTMGFEFWCQDFIYSLGIKISSLGKNLNLPSLSEIDAFYAAHNTFRPRSTPMSFQTVLNNFIYIFYKITMPTAGVGSVICFILIFCLSCIIFMLNKMSIISKKALLISDKLSISFKKIADSYLAIVLGATIGVLILGGLSVSIYLKHEFPLFAAIFLLAKGMILGWIIIFIVKRNQFNDKKIFAVLCLMFGSFLILDHIYTQYVNSKAITPMSVAWIKDVQTKPENTYIISWNPISIAPFTRNWVIGLKPNLTYEIIDRLIRNKTPFVTADLYGYDQQDQRPIKNVNYLHPDYWVIYQFDDRSAMKRSWPYKPQYISNVTEKSIEHRNLFFNKIDEVIENNNKVKLSSKGEDYVILDLRDLWK